MKNLIITSIITTALFCFPSQGTEIPKEEESSKPTIFEVSEKVPPMSINTFTLANPGILPQVMLTCKKWNLETQDLWKAASFVFYGIYIEDEFTEGKYRDIKKSPINTNEYYFKQRYNTLERFERSNFCSYFKFVFKTVVFSQIKEWSKEFYPLLQYDRYAKNPFINFNNAILSLMRKCAEFPDKLVTQYSLKGTIPNIPLIFNYLEIFKLGYQCHSSSIFKDVSLRNMRGCFDLLSKSLESETTRIEINRMIEPKQKEEHSFNAFFSHKHNKNIKVFQPLRDIMLPLYKMTFAKLKIGYDFFKTIEDAEVLNIMRKIPINISTLSQDIIELQRRAEEAFVPAEFQLNESMHRWYYNAQMLEYYLQIG